MRRLRTMRSRLALLIALSVLGSVMVFAAFTAAAFFLHERSEARSRAFTPETQAAEEGENRELVLAVGGSMVLALALTVPAAAALGRWLATRALAPMREAAARARAARDAERVQLPVRGLGDEWDELAAVMNELLAHQHRSIARQKAFTANVAHELRTPLTAMLGEVQVTLRRERAPGAYQQSLRAVEAETTRLASLVEALLTLARTDSGELRTTSVAFDLAEAACEAAERVRARAGSQRQLEVDADPAAVRGDPVLTGRVLDNLLENAMRHGASRVILRVRVAGDSGVAMVWDDGPGLPPAIRQRLFERFNKTPGASEGFGLGLAIAHALAVAQGGRLELDDGAPGSRFVLALPAEVPASERPRISGVGRDGVAPRPLPG